MGLDKQLQRFTLLLAKTYIYSGDTHAHARIHQHIHIRGFELKRFVFIIDDFRTFWLTLSVSPSRCVWYFSRFQHVFFCRFGVVIINKDGRLYYTTTLRWFWYLFAAHTHTYSLSIVQAHTAATARRMKIGADFRDKW